MDPAAAPQTATTLAPAGPAGGVAPATGWATPTSAVMVLLGAAILAFTLVRTFRRGKGAGGDDVLAHIERVRAAQRAGRTPGADAGLDPDVVADAEELTRRLAAELDGRAERLERLLARAERVLARLEAAGSVTQGAALENPGHAAPGVQIPRPPRRPTVMEPGPSEIDPIRAQVYGLADAGQSPVEIAQKLGQPTGNIELMLALRR